MLSYLNYALSTYAADMDGVMRYVYIICGAWLVLAEGVLFAFVWQGRGRATAGWVLGSTWQAAS
ncbi:MAG: hypothetical protein EXR69_13960 [Myxococcales bacterium]|nr:hypothetical protein [Myxococcales bacterium]